MPWSKEFSRTLYICFRALWIVGWLALVWGLAVTTYHASKKPQTEPTGVFTYVPVKLTGVGGEVVFTGSTGIRQTVEVVRADGDLRFHNPDDPYFLLGNGIYLLWLLTGLGIVQQLKRIFASLVRDRALVRENIWRAQCAGVFLIAGYLLHAGWICWLSHHYAATIAAAGIQFAPRGFEPNLPGIATGVVVIALAELFRQGASLREEHDLTI